MEKGVFVSALKYTGCGFGDCGNSSSGGFFFFDCWDDVIDCLIF